MSIDEFFVKLKEIVDTGFARPFISNPIQSIRLERIDEYGPHVYCPIVAVCAMVGGIYKNATPVELFEAGHEVGLSIPDIHEIALAADYGKHIESYNAKYRDEMEQICFPNGVPNYEKSR